MAGESSGLMVGPLLRRNDVVDVELSSGRKEAVLAGITCPQPNGETYQRIVRVVPLAAGQFLKQHAEGGPPGHSAVRLRRRLA